VCSYDKQSKFLCNQEVQPEIMHYKNMVKIFHIALGINVNWFIKEHIYLSANSNKLTKKVKQYIAIKYWLYLKMTFIIPS
jgi:hypothetical protein